MSKEDIINKSKTIWLVLFHKRKLSIGEIEEMTKSKNSHVLLSLGWLFKEGKINFQDENGVLYAVSNDCGSDIYY